MTVLGPGATCCKQANCDVECDFDTPATVAAESLPIASCAECFDEGYETTLVEDSDGELMCPVHDLEGLK